MHEGRYQRARAAARPGVARALRRATPARTARAAFVMGALLALAWATNVALPAGLAPLGSPAPAAAATNVAISLGSARVAGGSGQVRVVLGVDNPRPAFPGWVEIRGVERRTVSAVEVPAGASELRVWASPGDSGGGLSVRLLDSSERPVSSSQDLVLDYSASVLVVGARSADYAFLADVLGMSVERSASFPHDPREYGLYAAVVLAEPEREALARSAGPLLDWTRQGGLLVWAAGEEAKPTESDEVADIFPASPAERSAVSDATPILVSVSGQRTGVVGATGTGGR